MKQKLFLIPLVLISLIVLMQAVSAASVTTSLFFDATTEDTLTITHGEQFGISVSADSVFEDNMTITVNLLDSNGNLINNLINAFTIQDSYSNHITIGPAAYEIPGNYRIVSRVTGESGQIATDYLYLNVNPVTAPNNPPVITSTPVTQVNEGEEYVYQVTATDEDGDVLTYSLTQAPDWLSIDSDTGLVTGIAPFIDSDYVYAVTIIVSDGIDTTMQFYSLTVYNLVSINHPPVITSTPVTQVNEGEEYVYQVTATDADGDFLIYSLIQAPSWLSINADTGMITGTAPIVNEDTFFEVVVEVSDGIDSDTQSYVLTVLNVPVPENNPPVITSTPVTQVNESQEYLYQIVAEDVDGDALTYFFITAPDWLSIDADTGLITGTAPSVDENTEFNIVIRVSDGIDFDEQSYVLTVIDTSVPDEDDEEKSSSGRGTGSKTITDSFYEEQYFNQFEKKTVIDLGEDLIKETSEPGSRILVFFMIIIFITIICIIVILLLKYN